MLPRIPPLSLQLLTSFTALSARVFPGKAANLSFPDDDAAFAVLAWILF